MVSGGWELDPGGTVKSGGIGKSLWEGKSKKISELKKQERTLKIKVLRDRQKRRN